MEKKEKDTAAADLHTEKKEKDTVAADLHTEEKEKDTAAADLIAEIEHWYNVHGTSPAVYAGTMCFKGWKPGKQVTGQEYLAAVSEFRQAAMSGTGGRK